MFRSKTLFVLGAGASHEARMPLGSELITQVSCALDIKFDRSSLISGSSDITDAMKKHANGGDQNINPYLKAGWAIRDSAHV